MVEKILILFIASCHPSLVVAGPALPGPVLAGLAAHIGNKHLR